MNKLITFLLLVLVSLSGVVTVAACNELIVMRNSIESGK